MTKMLRHQPRFAVALYRVSTAEQGQSGLGLEAQQATVRAFVTAQGWSLLAEHSDIAIVDKRPHGTRHSSRYQLFVGPSGAGTPRRTTCRSALGRECRPGGRPGLCALSQADCCLDRQVVGRNPGELRVVDLNARHRTVRVSKDPIKRPDRKP